MSDQTITVTRMQRDGWFTGEVYIPVFFWNTKLQETQILNSTFRITSDDGEVRIRHQEEDIVIFFRDKDRVRAALMEVDILVSIESSLDINWDDNEIHKQMLQTAAAASWEGRFNLPLPNPVAS